MRKRELANKSKQKRHNTTVRFKKRKTEGQLHQEEKKTRSSLEDIAIKSLKRMQIPFEYEPKDKKVNYIKPATNHKYLPDIVIDGVIYELKGRFQMSDRMKMKLIKEQYPDLELVMVFMRDQPIYKGSKTYYSNWCDKVGIKWILFEDFDNEVLKRHSRTK